MKKYFKELDKLDIEFPNQKATIKPLKAVNIEQNDSLLMCTTWNNGEGYELSFSDDKGNDKQFSIHVREIELLMRALKELKYF